MNNQPILDVHDKPKTTQWFTLSIQHLFAMFGSTILVPYLVGLDPAIALISSGLGTLAFLLITKFQVPAYLGSSFAYIVPIKLMNDSFGPGATMVGTFLVGLVYGAIALIIRKSGYRWIMNLLPPVVVGPVIIVIGLSVAGTAVNMATQDTAGKYSMLHFSVALVTLAATIIFTIFAKKLLSTIPILAGIIAGYIYAVIVGVVDFEPVMKAHWFEMPEFVIPFVSYKVNFTWDIFWLMVPVAIVTISEHIGHQLILSDVVGRNYIKEPGLHRSILGDGMGSIISALIGGPPKTTYGENIGVLVITRIYSVYVLAGAGIFAILFGFIGKITALIHSIPTPVMGGVSILLFGIIASSGLRMLVDNKINFGDNRNLVITSVILIIGVGGAILKLPFKDIQIQGMALAAIFGVLLNLVLPGRQPVSDNMFEAHGDDEKKTA